MSRILAIDYGSKRIGLAVSDLDRRIASPLAVHGRQNEAQDARFFKKIVDDERIGLLVVGLPVHMSGQEGQKAGQARAFGDWLAVTLGLPLIYWDERFTTADAERHMLDAGLTKKQRDQRRDMVAAQILLQSYLNAGCPPASDLKAIEDTSEPEA